MVLVSRCLQAVGAAAIPATAMLIPIRYIAPERRGSAMATAFVGLSIGSALGPIVSSLVASIADWRWLFCIPPLILITIPLYRKYLKEEELQSSGPFDWLGGGLLAVRSPFSCSASRTDPGGASTWPLAMGRLSYVFVRRCSVCRSGIIPEQKLYPPINRDVHR